MKFFGYTECFVYRLLKDQDALSTKVHEGRVNRKLIIARVKSAVNDLI